MGIKSLEEYFNPKKEELKSLESQERTLKNFAGTLFVKEMNDGKRRFFSEDFSLADKVKLDSIQLSGDFLSEEYEGKFIFRPYFNLISKEKDKNIPIYLFNHEMDLKKMNVIYLYKSYHKKNGHYDYIRMVEIIHPTSSENILEFCKNLEIRESLLFEIDSKINKIRKENPAGVHWKR